MKGFNEIWRFFKAFKYQSWDLTISSEIESNLYSIFRSISQKSRIHQTIFFLSVLVWHYFHTIKQANLRRELSAKNRSQYLMTSKLLISAPRLLLCTNITIKNEEKKSVLFLKRLDWEADSPLQNIYKWGRFFVVSKWMISYKISILLRIIRFRN